MKSIFKKVITLLMMAIAIVSSNTKVFADELINHKYIDFSSDRSTYFFRLEGGDDNKVFFDFFSPFDPTAKVTAYDQLTMYELENKYFFDENNILMININDLKKLYDPYFDYEIQDNSLKIVHTVYDKLITNGLGERATTLEYTKKVWNLKVELNEGKMNSGSYDYIEYTPTIGGRNKGDIVDTEVNEEKSKRDNIFTLEKGKIQIKDGEYYIPLAEVMELMGKTSIEEKGYLAIQQENLADVTVEVERSESTNSIVLPRATNVWTSGSLEKKDENYTWADYMNDVADGKRNTGWLWKSFYIPSGSNFKDGDGNVVTLEANRIVPFNIYVPTKYDKDETRLTYMLHGATGNENTSTDRIMERGVEVDKIAEEYNYIIVSPNGWVQNPIWRENQSLYSFEKSFEMVMKEYPVAEDKIFITGNSLGGRGTLEVVMRFPDRFNAFATSAPKILDRVGNSRFITIEDTKYNLSNVENKPAMIIQGTADGTTSFKTQIGSSSSLGAIAKAIMPNLNNATYVTVEQGNHSHAYGWVLTGIFDFFESTITPNKEENIKTVDIEKNSKKLLIDGVKHKLNKSSEVVNDTTTMITLSDLEKIYGEEIKIYPVYSYDSDPEKSINYYTVIYNNKSINFTLNETIYRKNMERYKEDADILKNGSNSDEDELELAPHLSVAPYEKSGEIFVPIEEISNALELNINIVEKSTNNQLQVIVVLVVLVLVIISGIVYKLRKH